MEPKVKMLRPYWLDACSIVKLVVEEPGHQGLKEIFNTESWFETTWLCFGEALGVLKRKCFIEDKFTPEDYYRKIHLLRSYMGKNRVRIRLAWIEYTEKDFATYLFIRDYGISRRLDFSDVMQLFEISNVLKSHGMRQYDAVMVTSDQALRTAAEQTGMKVWDPEKEPKPPA